jgi:Ni/Fe-hydrogenase subunit HybB-like protein
MFMIERAVVGSRRHWTWILFLLGVIGVGFLCYLRQLSYGLGITGMSRNVPWGLYIGQFTFLVGVAASAVMVVLPYYLHNHKEFTRMAILSKFRAISSVSMCMLFIFVDMGQPWRILNVMLYPTPRSMMFWDMVSLSGYLALNAVIALVTLMRNDKGVAPAAWIKPVILLSIPWAICGSTKEFVWWCPALCPRLSQA